MKVVRSLVLLVSILFVGASAYSKPAFNALPKNVQTLMQNELKFAEKVKSFNESKVETQVSLFEFKKRCDPSEPDDDDEPDSNGCYRGEYNCVPNCTWRSSNGSCISYGSDFCGCNANCVENCTWRASNGDCISYDGDLCY